MKKSLSILGSALLVLSTLSGCTDAEAKLSDSNTVIMTIGNTKVTKGQVYTTLYANYGATLAVTNAKHVIAEDLIETTDEMTEQAETLIESYKSYYGDAFTTMLETSNMTEDEYKESYITSVKTGQLTDLYIEDNFDVLVEEYAPVQATVLSFSDTDNANSALSALKDGTMTASEAASEYDSNTSGDSEVITIEDTSSYDTEALALIRSLTPDDGWSQVTSSSSDTVYLIHVDSNDATEFKDEFIASIDALDDVKDDAITYYFTKYNFHIYDINLYTSISNDYPEAIVQ